jgi:hypothetical protein
MTAGSGNRSDAKAQVEFGISVAQRGLWKEATQRWERATVTDPTYAAAWNNLGIGYEQLGRFDDARKAYEKAWSSIRTTRSSRLTTICSEKSMTARTVAAVASLAVGLATAGCVNFYEVTVETPIQAKLDVTPFQRVLVAGFLGGGTKNLDAAAETSRLLRSQLAHEIRHARDRRRRAAARPGSRQAPHDAAPAWRHGSGRTAHQERSRPQGIRTDSDGHRVLEEGSARSIRARSSSRGQFSLPRSRAAASSRNHASTPTRWAGCRSKNGASSRTRRATP